MLERDKKDILLVGQTPPPFHGQAIVTDMLFEHSWKELKVQKLRMSYSDSIDGVGCASIGKVAHLIWLILTTWKIVLLQNPRVLYYLPASANKVPVIRDIIYLIAVKWCFSKKVFHYHAGGLPDYLSKAGLLGHIARWVYSGADTSIEICQTDNPPAIAFGAKKQVIVPNGLDVDIVNTGSKNEARVVGVLFVGALNEGKGVLGILEAIDCLKLKNPDLIFKMSFAGAWTSKAFQNECQDFISNKQLNNVEFLGVLEGKEKWEVYTKSDIFFFPSHYQSENFPLVLIEAMACGLPLITTNWRGIPQLVEGSNAAILCDVKSNTQFVNALELYIRNKKMRLEYSFNAREHYKKHFTKRIFLQRMEAVFNDLTLR